MEWSMAVNEFLRSEITKLDYTLIPPGFHGDVRTLRFMQDCLAKIIDNLGEQSATAQGLNKVITTGEKLRNSPTHVFYLLKDEHGNSGRGSVIGFLKMGHKKLFLFDQHDKVREVEPLCVLDFYVVKDRQRHGYGKVLFDHMIQDSGINPKKLAIDGPSEKMAAFMKKNYGFSSLLRQANNFAVAPEFFQDSGAVSSGRSTPAVAPAAVGRYSAKKPHSAIANVIHGGTPFKQEASARHRVITNKRRAVNQWTSHHQMVDAASWTGDRNNGVETPEPAPSAPEQAPSAPEPAPEPAERPSSLLIETAEAPQPAPEASQPSPLPPRSAAPSPAAGAATERRDSQVTERGYFDIKFYHNKLW